MVKVTLKLWSSPTFKRADSSLVIDAVKAPKFAGDEMETAPLKMLKVKKVPSAFGSDTLMAVQEVRSSGIKVPA